MEGAPPQANNEPPRKQIKIAEVKEAFLPAYGKNGTEDGKKYFKKLFNDYIVQESGAFEAAQKYNVIILFDNTTLYKGDSDKIYQAAKSFEKNGKPLLLILVSQGGEPGAAYLIGKLCREFSNGKFIVVVPRHAKSAATLLACAAEEIHMGSLSELGPIDPQIDGMPALGLKNSIEHIVELVAKTPSSSDMFAKYLNSSVEPIEIGYYERVAESAAQYAEKLLSPHSATLKNSPEDISTKLVKEYKDHGFVIDKEEAATIFGVETIKSVTPEYFLGDKIYEILSEIEMYADILDFQFYFIGKIGDSPNAWKKKKRVS